MLKIHPAAVAAVPFIAFVLSACTSQQDYYNQVAQQNMQLQSQNAQLHSQLATTEAENKWIKAGDLLFAKGEWELTANGKTSLDDLVPRLRSLTNAKIVVYGYTDSTPIGADLKRKGIVNNLDLSSRRAGAVVTYFASQGVDKNIMSAKGRGETHPVASNDTADGRAQNRRVEVVLEGPGA